ncbi:MAG TPA: N-acetylmuramic acid 6-phosphate etherase [Candidatus Angelobacter sp.]|nr:N-acetylmuramic acid 6-phosphate etherase [Candidatus Angelobacter sp.]
MSPPESNIPELETERDNSASAQLDILSAQEIAQLLNAEDKKVPAAVEQALPQIAQAIDLIANAILGGGRLIYVGAGTSGRMAALDASEIPPTFGVDPKTIQYVIAGGSKALGQATEYSEDSRASGRLDLRKRKPGKKDVVVGLAASGRTPYTVAALEYARKKGAKTVAVVCNRNSELGRLADVEIVIEVGSEAVSGSTRMKAGSAQKMALNMLSTGAMARLGYVYGNLMVNVQILNRKLVERGLAILEKAAGVDRQSAAKTLRAADNHVAVALIMLKTGLGRKQAIQRLKSVKGNVRQAVAMG